MKFIELFPTLLLGGILDKITSEQMNSYKTHLLSIQYIDENQNGKSSLDQHILDNPLFFNLKNSIFEFSFKYLKKLNHVVEDLQISNSWSNILDKNETIHEHTHANSYISGVFYLDNSSPIAFKNPTSFYKYGWNPEFSSSEDPNIVLVTPERGLLLIFPSWLKHAVFSSQEDNRMSIAFNILPKGKFGPNTGRINL
jgi:uncharacterized protein (TIGR02466 family)